MSTVKLVEYDEANAEVKSVYDDIRQIRQTDFINNFWKALANHPALLKRVWSAGKEVMAPGELDALTKEMIYVAISIANACEYCVHSHTSAAFSKGMTEAQYGELLAVIALAQQNNGLASGMQVPVDEVFKKD